MQLNGGPQSSALILNLAFIRSLGRSRIQGVPRPRLLSVMRAHSLSFGRRYTCDFSSIYISPDAHGVTKPELVLRRYGTSRTENVDKRSWALLERRIP